MLLTIDIGNSNLKLGLFEHDQLLATWRLASDRRRTSDEYGVQIIGLLSHYAPGFLVDGVVVGSVVPRLDPILAEACERYLRVKPLFLGPGVDPGLPVLVDSPEQVGVDRLADALAGLRLYGCPLITIDFGSATCFTAISREGAFVGGAIAAGLASALEAMVGATAKLPPIPLLAPEKVVGRNTVTAMQSGLVYGHVGLVEYTVKRFWEEIGRCKVVATGGHSQLIASQTSLIDVVDPHLTLQGMRLAYELNAARGAKNAAAAR
jgi:type III pantothenate kinase